MSLKIQKLGKIFDVSEDWGKDAGYTHCHKPTPFLLDDETIRVYFGVRDKQNHTKISFVDLYARDLTIKYIHRKIILDLGNLGTFDDVGAQVCSVVRVDDNTVYMYYIGWNTSTTVPSRNALGLAVSYDNGYSFKRMYEGPILERYKEEPYYIGASDVMYDGTKWKMWYDSGLGFIRINGHIEYKDQIKYAESDNGIDWIRNNIVCICPNDGEAVVRPSVIKYCNKYLMFYSYRGLEDFRTNKKNSYRFGYAESSDGINWVRKDKEIIMNPSENLSDWDSIMVAYPFACKFQEELLLFYNGNSFGKTGFGAVKVLL